MLTITKELKEKFKKYPLYSQDGKGLDAVVIAKFFLPFSACTWLATEAEEQPDGDIVFFGYNYIQTGELGYFTLKEMQKVDIKGITIEIDKDFAEGQTIKEAAKKLGIDLQE